MGRRYDARMEEGLEAAYQGHLARRGVREQAARAKRARLEDGAESGADEGQQEDGGEVQAGQAEAPADSDDEVSPCLGVLLDWA